MKLEDMTLTDLYTLRDSYDNQIRAQQDTIAFSNMMKTHGYGSTSLMGDVDPMLRNRLAMIEEAITAKEELIDWK